MAPSTPPDRGSSALLVELLVADPPEAWIAAGFTVSDDTVRLGATRIGLTGTSEPGRRGIWGWRIAGLELSGMTLDGPGLDGLPTEGAPNPPDAAGHAGNAERERAEADPIHPNGAIKLDHVVIATPDLERTIAAFGRVHLGVRRIRETTANGSPMRQAFLRLGPTIVEVVSGDTGTGAPASESPATWWGLAIDVADLDATADLLGDGLGAIKDAVQDGRRIATFRHKALGMSIAVAAMDDHADRVNRVAR
ncbi:MAG: VOC family protein [Aquihabitans sp.]